jgi:hypothetical protein
MFQLPLGWSLGNHYGDLFFFARLYDIKLNMHPNLFFIDPLF